MSYITGCSFCKCGIQFERLCVQKSEHMGVLLKYPMPNSVQPSQQNGAVSVSVTRGIGFRAERTETTEVHTIYQFYATCKSKLFSFSHASGCEAALLVSAMVRSATRLCYQGHKPSSFV